MQFNVHLIREFPSHTIRRSDFEVYPPTRAKQRVQYTFYVPFLAIHTQFVCNVVYENHSRDSFCYATALLQATNKEVLNFEPNLSVPNYKDRINISCYFLQDNLIIKGQPYLKDTQSLQNLPPFFQGICLWHG